MSIVFPNTATTVKIGPFLDTDGDPVTNLTISQADVRLSKNGGDFVQKNESSAATHDEGGWYNVALDATDTNTVGRLTLSVQETGALPVWHEYTVDRTVSSVVASSGGAQVGGYSATALAQLNSMFSVMAANVNANTTALLTGIYAGDLPPNPTMTAPVHIIAGDTFRQRFVIGDITGNSEIHFAVKAARTDDDTAAMVWISKTGGLEYIDGGAAVTAANGSITVNDASSGDITVFLDEAETLKLQDNATSSAVVGIKVIVNSDADTEAIGTAVIFPAVVQAIS